MFKYDFKRETGVLICNHCGRSFVPEEKTEDIAELRALSMKYGWVHKKHIEAGVKVQENLCPNCARPS